MTLQMLTMARNVGLLMLIVFPSFLVLFLLQVAVTPREMFRDVPDALTFALFMYTTNAIPVCALGIMHQVACRLFPGHWSPLAARAVAYVLSLLIPAAAIVFGFAGNVVTDALVAIAFPSMIALALYAALMKLPSTTGADVPPRTGWWRA